MGEAGDYSAARREAHPGNFGGHDLLYITRRSKVRYFLWESPETTSHNYGGDKIWPMPEGNQDEQHWSGSYGNLDSGSFHPAGAFAGPNCAVRMTGPVNPEIGQRYIRDISIGGDTPVISFHVAMQNMSGFPQTWSEQTITEYPTSNPSGSEHFTKFWGVTHLNPKSVYPKGYFVRTGPQDNPAFSVADGNLRVHWNDIMQEVWIDPPRRMAGSCDGETSTRWWSATRWIRTKYPGKAKIIFYSSGPPESRPNHPAEPREGPFVECEVNSPMVKLAPGESYAMDTQWFPTRMGEDLKRPPIAEL